MLILVVAYRRLINLLTLIPGGNEGNRITVLRITLIHKSPRVKDKKELNTLC